MSGVDRADVCIVGSGVAGAIPAAVLAGAGHDVVVLEAGARFGMDERRRILERALRPEYGHLDTWGMDTSRDGFTVGADPYDLNRLRVKAVGGTTLHWGGVTPRFHPEDFETDSRYGVGEDWPLDYDDLEPYYGRAEAELGVSGEPYAFAGPRSDPYPLPAFPPSYSDGLFEEACDALGIELHAVPRAMASETYEGRSPCIGYGTCQLVCPSGGKYDGSVHVRRAEAAGATVRHEAPVRRLEVDDRGERVVAARYTTADGTERRVRADQFVLACGAVETARLLLASATPRYPDGLANTSGAVGRRFSDHAGMVLVGSLDRPTRQNLIGFSTRMTEQFYDRDTGPRGSVIVKMSNTAGPAPVSEALSDVAHTRRLLDGDLAGLLGDRFDPDAFVESYRERSTNLVSITVWVGQRPDPANRVTLDPDETDDYGTPVPRVTWRAGDAATEHLEAAAEIAREILAEVGATDVTTVGTPTNPLAMSHRVGTTRMGTDPAASVVRPDCRTHDLRNLSVSSGATFVTNPAANPTLTIAALALRLADRIEADLRAA